MYRTFQLYQKPSLAFSLKLISSRVPLCIIHHLTVYLKPCFPVSMRCSWNTWMQATFIICILLGHLLHFLFLRGMVNSAWFANFQALDNVMIPEVLHGKHPGHLTFCCTEREDICQAGLQGCLLPDAYEWGWHFQDSYYYSPWVVGMGCYASQHLQCAIFLHSANAWTWPPHTWPLAVFQPCTWLPCGCQPCMGFSHSCFFPMPSQIPRDIFRLQILLKFLSSFPICKRASLCYGLSACLVGVLLCLFLFLTMCWLGRTVLSVYIDTSAQVGVRAEPSPPIGPSMVGFIPMHLMALAGVIWSKNTASDFWQLLFLKHSQWSWQPPVVSLSMRYVCFEAWWTFDNVVILHCSHLLGMNHYLSDSPIAGIYCISCTEGLSSVWLVNQSSMLMT